MRVRWFAAFAVVVLAAGAFFVVNSRDASEPKQVDALRRATPAAPPAPASVAAASESLTPKRTDALALEWNDASNDVVGPVVEGTIVVTDLHDPTRETEEEGSFVPDFIDGVDADADASDPGHAPRRVAVKHGRFRFDARGATAMLVKGVELRGRPACVNHGVDLTTGKPLALEAWWFDDVLLHVVDAATKRELDDVTVVRRDNSDGGTSVGLPGHPGVVHPVDLLRDGARSPLHLTLGTATERAMLMTGWIWVGAHGHAWKRVTLDFEHERERTVELGPGGALDVTVTEPASANGAEADAAERSAVARASDRWPRLRLRQPQADAVGSLFADLAADPEEYRLEGLEPGELTAAIEIGNPFPAPLVVSRAAVTIVAGATTHATLSIDLSKAPKPTTLAGTVYVPPAWGETGLEIAVAPIDLRGAINADLRRTTGALLDPIPGRPGWHHWSISPTLPATYELVVELAGFATKVEVGAEGRDDVVITLPEPAVVRVRLVDEETQGEIAAKELMWMPDGEGGDVDGNEGGVHRLFGMPRMLAWDPEAKCCVGAVQPGRGQIQSVNVEFASAGIVATGEEFTVRAGDNDLVVHVRAPCGVEFEVVQDGEVSSAIVVAWQRIGSSAPESSGTQVVPGRIFRIPARLYLPGPGRYRISRHATAKGGPDFSFEVDIAKGEFVKRTIELQKE